MMPISPNKSSLSTRSLNISSLNIENLSVSFDDKKVLLDFSLSLNEGEILCLLGPSGCGKTTALKAMAGLLDAQFGKIDLFGKLIKDNSFELAPEKRDIGFIFQDYALFPHMSVGQNIAFALKGQSKSAINKVIESNLAMVHLDGLQDRYPHELSGGQQQRTAVARALANRPKLLLMDEPFSNIDSQVKQSLMRELRQLLKTHNITCIFVTHAKQEAFAFADKTAILNEGKLVQVDSSQKIYEQPKDVFVAKFMESGNLIAASQLPTGLFLKALPKHDETGFCLLHENGFMVNSAQGEKVTVIDSLYIGHKYRLEVTFNGRTLFIESEYALEIGREIMVQYQHQPVWVAQ